MEAASDASEYAFSARSESSEGSTRASTVSSQGSRIDTSEVKPYAVYLPVGKRTQLAQLEFEVQMMEREVRMGELDQARQKYLVPKRRVFTIPFFLAEAKLKLAVERFPRTIFRVGQDTGHDHPLSHLENMIGINSVARMFRGGDKVLGVYTSPKVIAQLNHQQRNSNNPKEFISICKLRTEKDYLRKIEWDRHPHCLLEDGETLETVFDCTAWRSPRGEGPQPKCMLMFIQSLYYLSNEEIAMCLQRPGTMAIALLHRHRHDSGTMFIDEVKYAKKDGMVEQVNVATGERYVHRDLSWLFDSTTKVMYTAKGAFCWTLHKVTDETWIIELVSCSENMNERFTSRSKAIGKLSAAMELNEHAEVPSPFPHRQLMKIPGVVCTMVAGLPVVRFSGSEVRVNVTSPELVEFLALHMAGKPRDMTRIADCFALAVAHVDDGMDFPGKMRFKVHSSDLAGHVLLGYMSSFGEELNVVRALPAFKTFFQEHKAHLEGHSLMMGVNDSSFGTRAAVQALSRFNEASKLGNAIDGVLHAINM